MHLDEARHLQRRTFAQTLDSIFRLLAGASVVAFLFASGHSIIAIWVALNALVCLFTVEASIYREARQQPMLRRRH